MTFSQFDFDPRVEAGITASGYLRPTPIQQAAIPEVLDGRDVVGIAQTGTGKTAAFILPIFQRLLDGPRSRVRALVMAPTRELAEQTCRVARALGKRTGLRVTAIYGGVSKAPQAAALRRGVDVVVACPGRLLDLHDDGAVDLSGIETFVLDEADRMLDMGFLPDLRRLLALLPAARQNLLFSATMPPTIRALAGSTLVDPVSLTVDEPAPAATVSHALYPVPEMLKGPLIAELLKDADHGPTLIFARTKHRARGLARNLARLGHRVASLEGGMSQTQRQRAIDGFRRGTFDVLVATDVAARGIDVAGIARVVNYDMPDTIDAYTHRVGRTGRAQATGEALNLVSVMDTPLVREIQARQKAPLEQRVVSGFDYGDFTPRLFILPAKSHSPRRLGPGHRRGHRVA